MRLYIYFNSYMVYAHSFIFQYSLVPLTEDILLQDDLVYLMPMVQEANAIAEELGKTVTFEIILVSPQAFGQKDGRAEVSISMIYIDFCRSVCTNVRT